MQILHEHVFSGRWITLPSLGALKPNNVFHRQLDTSAIADIDRAVQNQHVLFRRTFTRPQAAVVRVFITADDYYKLWRSPRAQRSGARARNRNRNKTR